MKKKIQIILFLFTLIFGISTSVVHVDAQERTYPSIGEEYLKNNDFSQDLVAFNDVADFVDTNFVNLMCEYTKADAETRSKGGAVKLQYDSADNHLNVNDYPAIWQDVNVKQNTYYEWSAYVKRTGSAENGFLALGYRNPLAADKWVAVSQNIFHDTTSNYEKISILIYTAELTAIRASIHCQCMSSGKDGYYLIDDVSLKEVRIEDYIDTSSTAPTNCKIADQSTQYVNDSSFENSTIQPCQNTLEKSRIWRSFSWAGQDRNGWGSDGSLSNVFLTFNNNGLEAGERPALGQDLLLKKNTYYVVSFYAKKWENFEKTSPLTVAFQDSNGANSGTDNNTSMFKKNLDSVSFNDLSTNWVEKIAVLYTGEYTENRLVFYTTAVEHDGKINGYHIDNVRVWEALEPEEVQLNVSAGYKIGKDVNPKITVKFKNQDQFVDVPSSSHIRTHYEIGDSKVFASDLDNHLVPLIKGSSSIKLNLEIFGKTISSNTLNLTVNEGNVNPDRYIQSVEVSTSQAISTDKYATVNVDVYDQDSKIIYESETHTEVQAENPKVVYVRELTTGYHVLGISKGNSKVYVTVTCGDSIGIGSMDLTVDTDNLLVDSSFEAQNEFSYWKVSGNGGSSVDDGQTNIYRRSGYANLWTMAPIFWDGNIPYNAQIDLSQYVDITEGKYDLSCYINRYHANGVNGELSSNGGLVTLSATPVDENGTQIGDPIFREFDCSYGNFTYGKLSLVFDCKTPSRYLVNLHIQGDETFGFGMQIDDFTLSQVVYPVELVATLDETITTLDLESIYSIYVYAIYEGNRKEEITTDLRFIFDDFSICVYSNGYLFPKKTGETTVTVRANILDKVYETKLKLIVGTPKKVQPEIKNNLPLIIGLSVGGGVVILGGLTITLVVIKKKKGGHYEK